VLPKHIASFLERHNAKIVNVAGKRESAAPGIAKWVAEMLDQSIDVGR
jgi:hypothetical protein